MSLIKINTTIYFSFVLIIILFTDCQFAQAHKISHAFSIKEKDLIPEGIIYDKKEKVFYVGSINKQKIIRLEKTGKTYDFKKPKEDGLYSVLGMKIDDKRKELWVCTFAGSGFNKEEGSAGIFKYDLKTGKLKNKYLADNKTLKHLFNDIVITADGDAYFTDSDAGIIYLINHLRNKIEIFIPSGVFVAPNGITLSPEGKYLFIADSSGIHRVDLNGNIRKLNQPDNLFSGGCDGIYFYKNSIVAVQNDIEPQRIVRFYLNKANDAIKKTDILCQDNPLVYIPTTGVIVDNDFYIIGNSQLNLYKDGKITDYNKLEDVRIVKIKL